MTQLQSSTETTATPKSNSTLTITFSKEDVDTIYWVGDRYCWSSVLGKFCFEEGDVEFEAEDVKEIMEEFERDTEGGHSMFPCLARGSSLHLKLRDLLSWAREEGLNDG